MLLPASERTLTKLLAKTQVKILTRPFDVFENERLRGLATNNYDIYVCSMLCRYVKNVVPVLSCYPFGYCRGSLQ